MRRKKSWPEEPPRSPIHFGELSNGEFVPRPRTRLEARCDELVHELAERCSKKLGMSRRDFLRSQMGTAAALSVINLAACRDDSGPFDVPDDDDTDGLCDQDGLRETLGGSEFILDCQTHHVDIEPDAPWLSNSGWVSWLQAMGAALGCAAPTQLECVGQAAYIDFVYQQSQTSVAVLTTPPASQDAHPMDNEHIRETRELINELAASERCLVHAGVLPNTPEGDLEAMAATAAQLHPNAWKVYTQWGPEGVGWFLDDTTGLAFCERVMAVDAPKVICVHKGLAFDGMVLDYASPRDIGPASGLFPEIQFVVYHSARDNGATEGPYSEVSSDQGSSRLVKTLQEEGIGPNGNVWAELGSSWNSLITRPDEAAHLLGKMLLYVGEDRVLWGTDCLWYGSPQPFIEAFRAFQIPEQMQEDYGYPALTDSIKAKVLGLNAAALHGVDPKAVLCSLADSKLGALRQEFPRERGPQGPAFFGPRNRRELLHLWARHGGRPG